MAVTPGKRRAVTSVAAEEQATLPGAERLATVIERRSFLRRMATTLFYGAVASASGTLSLSTFLADPAQAAGPCCPTCCGPSPCCESACCGASCCRPRDQWDTGGPCKDTTSGQCRGKWTGAYSDACWCCFVGGDKPYRKCCDCKIASGCGGISHCICHKKVNQSCDA
jgi:hypothetical protein